MKIFYLFCFLLFPLLTFSQVGINTTTPSPASVLDVNSSNDGINFGGFMPPRVSLIERDLIPVTAFDDGLMVFLIEGTTRCVQIWDGVNLAWEDVYCMPVNQTPEANLVTISGTFQVGEVITTNFTYTDAENDPAGAHVYTWYRADDNTGTNETQIQTGTSSTYNLTSSELNKYISVSVTPVATSGTSPGISVQSIYYGPIVNPSVTASDLFISEYVEGGSNRKLIEIANFTGADVDLSNYKLRKYVSGNAPPTDVSLATAGILLNGDVYVLAHNSTSPPCNTNIDQYSGSIDFNGNDVVELATISNVSVDIIGVIGVDNNFAKDVTLRKKTGVGPNTTYNTGDYNFEAQDDCTNIGSHTY